MYYSNANEIGGRITSSWRLLALRRRCSMTMLSSALPFVKVPVEPSETKQQGQGQWEKCLYGCTSRILCKQSTLHGPVRSIVIGGASPVGSGWRTVASRFSWPHSIAKRESEKCFASDACVRISRAAGGAPMIREPLRPGAGPLRSTINGQPPIS